MPQGARVFLYAALRAVTDQTGIRAKFSDNNARDFSVFSSVPGSELASIREAALIAPPSGHSRISTASFALQGLRHVFRDPLTAKGPNRRSGLL